MFFLQFIFFVISLIVNNLRFVLRTVFFIYLTTLFYLFPFTTHAQLLNPPYKAVKTNMELEFEKCYYESVNTDSTKKPYFIGFENHELINPTFIPSQMKFYNFEKRLIDAVNVKAGERYFQQGLFLSDFDGDGKNEVIVPVIGKHILKFYYIKLNKNSANKIIFLKIPFTKKIPTVEIHYFRAANNILIIYISTLFPGKHDYRRIYAINTQNFTVKWEKQTADYVWDLFEFPEQTDKNYFHFLTHPFDNGLIFSNNTFYRLTYVLEKNSNLPVTKAVVDTFFGKTPFRYPDSSAKDYSNDSTGYLVKMDMQGNVLMRKRFGGRLTCPNLFYPIRNDSLFFVIIDKVNNVVEIKLFLEKRQTIKTVKQLKHNEHIAVWRERNYLYFSDEHKLWKNSIYNLNAETDTLFLNCKINPVKNNPNYYYSYDNSNYYLYNKHFDYVSVIRHPTYGCQLMYFKSLKAFGVLSENRTDFYKLTKASLRERLNKTTFKWISATLIFLLILILLLWTYTMRLSRKKIEKNYQLLQKSNSELEAATAQLIRAEKLAVLGTIASAVAHQLNSPLGAILNSAQRIQSGGDIKDNINLIVKAATRSKKIVNRFLIASRPADNKETTADLNKAIDDFMELFYHNFEISGIQIKQKIEPNIKLKIKPEYLNEVLTNILFNARDSIIEKNVENRTIFITGYIEKNNGIIKIKDTGAGFSDLVLGANFEAFITTKEKGKGTGLGLWLVNKVISDAGGEIEIGNHKNGAFVIITIPLTEK
jgi:signal transduction histidine kinase